MSICSDSSLVGAIARSTNLEDRQHLDYYLADLVVQRANLTEKSGSSHQRQNSQHNDGKVTSLGSLFGVPVKVPMELLEENNNQTYIHKGFLSIQTGCLGALHREQSLTVLNS